MVAVELVIKYRIPNRSQADAIAAKRSSGSMRHPVCDDLILLLLCQIRVFRRDNPLDHPPSRSPHPSSNGQTLRLGLGGQQGNHLIVNLI